MGGLTQQPTPVQAEESGIWKPIAIGVAIVVVVLAAITIISRQEKKNAAPPPEYAARLQISNLKLSAAENFVGGTVTNLDGNITNAGDKTVTHATVEATFKNSLGELVQTEQIPIRILQTSGPYPDAVDLSMAPLAPGKSIPFRLVLEHISADWNQQYPDLKILQVTTR
jgi:hypothetical protein